MYKTSNSIVILSILKEVLISFCGKATDFILLVENLAKNRNMWNLKLPIQNIKFLNFPSFPHILKCIFCQLSVPMGHDAMGPPYTPC